MKSIIEQSEVFFWNSITTILENSKLVQKSIRIIYPIINNEELVQTGKISSLIGFSGLVTGMMATMFYYLVK